MAKPVRAKIVSPKGVAVYPRLNKPDTKFDAEGVYKVSLRLDPNDAEVASYLATIESFGAENDKKKMPFKHEADDKGVPTGMVLVNYKVAAKWPDKDGQIGDSRKPAVVDAGKNELTANVGGGSVIRISGQMSTYDGFGGGISLSPLAVQVLELKTWNAGVDDFDDESDDAKSAPAMQGDDEPEF
jgi:hypothetical protein